MDCSHDCCLEARKSITQLRVDSRGRILSVRICFKCVLRRGKDLIVLLASQGRQRGHKDITTVCRFWSIRQAFSKLQIDAEQSAISFRQEDRRRGRRAETVDHKSKTAQEQDSHWACGIGKIMSPRMIDGADRPGSDGLQPLAVQKSSTVQEQG